jgi:alkylation response protein AidB-like acyl-CoA dehydrogenase
MARRLARDHLALVAQRGTPGRVNRDLVRALGEDGLVARAFPRWEQPTARATVSAVTLAMIREGLAQFSTDAETAFAMQGLGGFPIAAGGSEDVVDRWLGPIVRGEAVAAFAMSEPEHGSDATGLQLLAERGDGGYRLTGEKAWISNAPDADVYTLFARTTPGDRAQGITAFVLPGDARGLTGESIELVSDHPIGRLHLDGVFLPDDHVLGEVDRGWDLATATFRRFRPSVGAFSVGMGQAALDATIAYAKEREQFGRPLRDFQALAHTIAEMATRLEAARALVYEATIAVELGGRDELASMAKLFATEQAQWIVDQAVQLHGAKALERGHRLEHLYRDVRGPRIYEGTSEIQREIIARALLR